MSWNYRILDHGTHLALHEVYYDETGMVTGWTVEPVTFVACVEEGAPGLQIALGNALDDAQRRPVLSVAALKAAHSLRPT